MAAGEHEGAVAPPIVIHVGVDYWRCRAWIAGVGECLAFVPLPEDGSPPPQCWRGHYQPWYGTFQREHRPVSATRPDVPAAGPDRPVGEHHPGLPRLRPLLPGGQLGDVRTSDRRVDANVGRVVDDRGLGDRHAG